MPVRIRKHSTGPYWIFCWNDLPGPCSRDNKEIRKEQLSGCHLKDGVQVHIHRVHILPDHLLPGHQVPVHRVRTRRVPGRQVPVHRVRIRPAADLHIPAVPGPVIPAVPDRAGILPRAGAAGRGSISPEGFAVRAAPGRHIITAGVMTMFSSLLPGQMKKPARTTRRDITMKTESTMMRYPLKRTAGLKM